MNCAFERWLTKLASVFVAIPVKELSESKTRLSSILSLEERKNLVSVMLSDVLNAVTQTSLVNRILVVSPNADSLVSLCHQMIEIIEEVDCQGLNPALKIAVDHAVQNAAGSLLILPADIPLIDRSDVELIIRASSNDGVVIVPSRDEIGTNALKLTPPNIIPTTFGPNSFQSHLNLAESHKTSTRILRLERVSLDIDTPDHLREFLSFPVPSGTRDYLFKISLTDRIRRL